MGHKMDNFELGGGKDFAFKHSKVAGQGLTQTKRIETASIVVAVDESGDFQSIQEAINSLNGEGGYIQVKEGNYKITEVIKIDSNITIEGVGYNTRIYRDTQGDVFQNRDITTGNINIKIKNMRVYSVDEFVSGVRLENCENVQYGIFIKDSKKILINNNFSLDDDIDEGIYLENVEKSIILNNHMLGYSFSIRLENSTKNIVSSNQCNDSTGAGIFLDTYSTKNIISNNSTTNSYEGVYIFGDYNIINSNNCANGVNNGIRLGLSSSFNIITSNLATITDNGTGNIKANNINL